MQHWVILPFVRIGNSGNWFLNWLLARAVWGVINLRNCEGVDELLLPVKGVMMGDWLDCAFLPFVWVKTWGRNHESTSYFSLICQWWGSVLRILRLLFHNVYMSVSLFIRIVIFLQNYTFCTRSSSSSNTYQQRLPNNCAIGDSYLHLLHPR